MWEEGSVEGCCTWDERKGSFPRQLQVEGWVDQLVGDSLEEVPQVHLEEVYLEVVSLVEESQVDKSLVDESLGEVS